MTDKEKKAIAKAFDIPEPDRKKEFTEEYRLRFSEKSKSPILPIVMKITGAAAVIAVSVGVIANMPNHPTDFDDADSIEAQTTVSEQYDGITTTVSEKSLSSHNTTKTTSVSEAATKTTTTGNDSAEKNSASASASTVVTTVRTTDVPDEGHTEPASSQTEAATAVTEKTVRDLTVTPDVVYTLRDRVIDKSFFDPKDGAGNAGDSIIKNADTVTENSWFRRMYDDSCAAVLAKIDKMVYTSIDGTAFTAENLTVQESFKGDFGIGDRLTVFMSGGYIPAEEYIRWFPSVSLSNAQDFSVHDSGGCMSVQETDRSYIFFIKKGASPFPDGSFLPAAQGDTAVFAEKNGQFISLGDNNLSFTAEAFKQFG